MPRFVFCKRLCKAEPSDWSPLAMEPIAQLHINYITERVEMGTSTGKQKMDNNERNQGLRVRGHGLTIETQNPKSQKPPRPNPNQVTTSSKTRLTSWNPRSKILSPSQALNHLTVKPKVGKSIFGLWAVTKISWAPHHIASCGWATYHSWLGLSLITFLSFITGWAAPRAITWLGQPYLAGLPLWLAGPPLELARLMLELDGTHKLGWATCTPGWANHTLG